MNEMVMEATYSTQTVDGLPDGVWIGKDVAQTQRRVKHIDGHVVKTSSEVRRGAVDGGS